MQKSIYRVLFNVAIAFFSLTMARSHPVDCTPRDLQQTVQRSSFVFVGRLKSYQSAKYSPKEPYEYDLTFGTKSNHNAGKYSFVVVQPLKGHCPPSLTLNLPPLTSRMYGNVRINLRPGNLFLLCLKRYSKGDYVPTEAGNPLVPLDVSAHVQQTAPSSAQKIDSALVSLLIGSLPSAGIRPLIAYFLVSFDDPRVLDALVPHLKDSDPQVQDSVLACMAKNQQVAAIPLIIRLNHQGLLTLGFGRSMSELENYHTKRAVPALNHAIYDSSVGIRTAAAGSLRKIQDVSSIPLLILALNDPEIIVAYHAYAGLHAMIPSLGPAKIVPDFEKNRKAETNLLLAWWKDELSGKHPKPKKPKTHAVALHQQSNPKLVRTTTQVSL